MPVLIRSHIRRVQFHHRTVKRVVAIILSAVGESSSDVGISFVGDGRMRRLNREYRKLDRTTDVLAFALRDARLPRAARAPSVSLGDVVISVPTALRQACKGGRSFDAEVAALLVHGILHLCGYDHERNETEARRMRGREKTILRRVHPVPRLTRAFPRR
jgi:rRNA maturation RNase YbeY